MKRTVDVFGAMSAMIRLYSALHPESRQHAVWEVDVDTRDALWNEARHLSGKALEIDDYAELHALGIRVVVVERPGVRLVIEAVT